MAYSQSTTAPKGRDPRVRKPTGERPEHLRKVVTFGEIHQEFLTLLKEMYQEVKRAPMPTTVAVQGKTKSRLPKQKGVQQASTPQRVFASVAGVTHRLSPYHLLFFCLIDDPTAPFRSGCIDKAITARMGKYERKYGEISDALGLLKVLKQEMARHEGELKQARDKLPPLYIREQLDGQRREYSEEQKKIIFAYQAKKKFYQIAAKQYIKQEEETLSSKQECLRSLESQATDIMNLVFLSAYRAWTRSGSDGGGDAYRIAMDRISLIEKMMARIVYMGLFYQESCSDRFLLLEPERISANITAIVDKIFSSAGSIVGAPKTVEEQANEFFALLSATQRLFKHLRTNLPKTMGAVAEDSAFWYEDIRHYCYLLGHDSHAADAAIVTDDEATLMIQNLLMPYMTLNFPRPDSHARAFKVPLVNNFQTLSRDFNYWACFYSSMLLRLYDQGNMGQAIPSLAALFLNQLISDKIQVTKAEIRVVPEENNMSVYTINAVISLNINESATFSMIIDTGKDERNLYWQITKVTFEPNISAFYRLVAPKAVTLDELLSKFHANFDKCCDHSFNDPSKVELKQNTYKYVEGFLRLMEQKCKESLPSEDMPHDRAMEYEGYAGFYYKLQRFSAILTLLSSSRLK